MVRMFNVVFFSVVGPLYQTDVSPYYVKTKSTGLDSAVLDYGYDDDEISQRNYFNVFTKGYASDQSSLVEQLKDYQTTTYAWKIQGDQVGTSADGNYYASTYGQNLDVVVNYTTSVVANNPDLSASETVTIDVRSLSGESVYNNAMDSLASLFQAALRNVDDERGTNMVQNANFNSQAFPNLTVSFNSTTRKFTVDHGANSPAYIYSLNGDSSTTDDPTSDMGLTSASTFLVTTDRELSNKIVTVVDDLDKRSQVTIRNIYVSPIIQTMKLIGKVYLKDLYDKTTERTNIEDAVYEWLNNNADFNEDIYISNITELIEQFPSVLYTNARFVPDVPESPTGGSFYESGNHPAVENAFTNASVKSDLYDIIDDEINDYILNAQNKTDTSGSSERNISYTIPSGIKVAQSYTFGWARTITERTFFEDFAKSLYIRLIANSTYSDWVDSDNFIDLINDIHKDYLEIIRFNLIDTQGNIAKDIQVDDEGVPLKGGYSLGSEIVKVNIDLTYEYKR